MINFDEPKFITKSFVWDELGYFFLEDPHIQFTDPAIFTNDCAWIRLAAVVENAKLGNFDYIGLTQEYLEFDSAPVVFKASCLWLMGDAGGDVEVDNLIETMKTSDDDYLRVKACEAASFMGYLGLAEHILEVWTNISVSEKGLLSLYLSNMLEQDAGLVYDFEMFEHNDEYVSHVSNVISELKIKLKSDKGIVFRGEKYSVNKLAAYIYGLLNSNKPDRIIAPEFPMLRHRFEAATGINCSSFFLRINLIETRRIR